MCVVMLKSHLMDFPSHVQIKDFHKSLTIFQTNFPIERDRLRVRVSSRTQHCVSRPQDRKRHARLVGPRQAHRLRAQQDEHERGRHNEHILWNR